MKLSLLAALPLLAAASPGGVRPRRLESDFALCVEDCIAANKEVGGLNAATACHSIEVYGKDFNECMKETKANFEAGGGTNGIGGFCRAGCDFLKTPVTTPPPPPCGDCLLENGTPGCTNAECETIVCAGDDFCCLANWDNICVEDAFSLCPCAIPANDECTAAEAIAWPTKNQPTTVSGTTIGSTDEDPEIVPDCDTSTERSIWYSVTVPNNKKVLVTLSTCNQADYDTKISIFRALDADADSCSGGLECVAGQDDTDGCAGFTTELGDLDLNHPLTYYILVHGFGGETGTFDLTVSLTPFDQCQCVQDCRNAFGFGGNTGE